MLQEKAFFKFFWSTMRYFGLQPHKINRTEKARALLIFIILAISNFVLYVVALVINDDFEARINGLQTFPFLVQVLLEAINFVINSKSIERTFNQVDEMFFKVEGQVYFDRGYSIFTIYNASNFISGMLATFGGIVSFGLTGKSLALIYTPFTHGFGFFLTWLLQGTFFIYSYFLNYLMDQILISLLIFLSFYLKALKRKIQTKEIADMKKIIHLTIEIKR